MDKGLPIIGDEPSQCSVGVAVNISQAVAKGEAPFRGRAAVVTLGCAKNQVDSEVMVGVLRNTGFEIVDDVSEADVAVINTCGFLESAVEEGLDCVLEVSQQKQEGRLRRLIVAGCMVERYKGDLAQELPEVDQFITTDDLLKVGSVATGEGVQALLDEAARPYFLYDDTMPRHLATRQHTAYVKIAEGCNRPCTFCIIPQIRGEMRSRTVDSVVSEVKELGAQGVQEVSLLAQDLTSYGTDRKVEGTKAGGLAVLLQSLDSAKAVNWVRLLYAYPIGVDQELLTTIRDSERVCNYMDIPLQHSSTSVLKAMKRPLGKYSPREFVKFVSEVAPEIALRTTFIVGFPGETEADIADLEQFVLEGHFTNVGVFTYSHESGSASYELEDSLSQEEKDKRRERVMSAQQQVVATRLDALIGEKLRVLVEGAHDDTDLLLAGRTEFQAPEVDGIVIINDINEEVGDVSPGMFVTVEITEVAGYDLVGRVVRE